MSFAWTWRRCKRAARRHPRPLIALCCAFGLLMSLTGAARLVSQLADSVLPLLADNVHVIAYLRDDMTPDRARAVAEIVARVPGVERVREVSSTEALHRLRAEADAMGGVAGLLEGVEEGFLPRSLEIRLLSSEGIDHRAGALAERLQRIPGVAHVDAMQDGLARLRSILGLFETLGWGLLALAFIVGVAVLVLPLFQGRQQRQQETAVLTLLGETTAGIRRPWAYAGAFAAVLGSTIAWLALWGTYTNVARILSPVLGGWAPAHFAFVPMHEILIAVVGAGFAGAWVGRFAMPVWKGRNV